MRDRPRRVRREAGAISVELALCTPVLLLLVLGGVHLGRALGTRHRLGDATSYAARTAAVSGDTAPAHVRALVQNRLGAAAGQCASLIVTSSVVGAPPARRLEVQTRCVLPPPFGQNLLADVGPFANELTVNAAFPF